MERTRLVAHAARRARGSSRTRLVAHAAEHDVETVIFDDAARASRNRDEADTIGLPWIDRHPRRR
jgi:hypothetical protein